jgi:hypothetical protein
MVSVLALSAVDRVFEPRLGQTKDYEIGIQCSLVKPPPSVQSVVWRYNKFDDKLRDIENRKLSDHMKR